MKILRKEKYLKFEERAMNIWDLFGCLGTYKKIINDDENEGDKNSNIFVNVSTGSKVSSIAGTRACMIWKGTTYYAHIEYNDKTDPDDGPDEDVNAIDEIPVYSINKPKDESLAVLKILSNVEGSQEMMKKNRLLEQLAVHAISNRPKRSSLSFIGFRKFESSVRSRQSMCL